MKVWTRFALLAVLAVLVLASLAFIGIRFAEKPVRWMPGALIVYFMLMLLGFIWALWPVRLPLRLLSVLLLFPVFAYVSYCALFWLWFAFGGQL